MLNRMVFKYKPWGAGAPEINPLVARLSGFFVFRLRMAKRFEYPTETGEFLHFCLSRIAGAALEFKLMRSDNGGPKLGFVLAGLAILVCLIAMSIYA